MFSCELVVMDKNKCANIMQTPLRNSNAANKPYCSPFKYNITPQKSDILKRLNSSPVQKDERLENNVIKRRRIDVYETENSNESTDNSEISKNDLLNVKKRVRNLRQEIDSLKVRLMYRKKHKKEDLRADIDRWRQACHRVLIQYQKDCSINAMDGKSVEITDILSTLGIPEDVVKLPNDY